jgi:hypothetical protein
MLSPARPAGFFGGAFGSYFLVEKSLAKTHIQIKMGHGVNLY